MLMEIRKIKTEYTRASKNKKSHAYTRYKTVLVIRCDSCGTLFEREQGSMDRKRATNNFQHVCPNCNPKKFAQKVGVVNRNFWNIPADSDVDITKL
jgi:rubredoxin